MVCSNAVLRLASKGIGAFACFALLQLSAGDVPVNLFKSVESDTDRWIQLQSEIAKTRADWASENALLDSNIKVLRAERSALEESLKSNKQASEILVANRDRLAAAVSENESGVASLKGPMGRVEASVRGLLPRLPDPLRQEVEAHLARLSNSDMGVEASVPSRAQGLVAALTAMDRFANSLTLTRTTQPDPKSGEVSVRVLYWGMAIAYALDEANRRAWVVRPSDLGWQWEERNDLFDQVESLITGYASDTEDPRLVLIPATIN